MIKRIVGRIQKEFLLSVIRFKGFQATNNHYIFSSPRGGSTWLMEVIQQITKEPVIFEPLFIGIKKHPLNKINFGWRQYIPEDAIWEEAKIIFDSILSGSVLPESITSKTDLQSVLKTDSLLFKICRGNALLPWLVANYSFHHKPIYLIRHPFAVASSQLRYEGWSVSTRFEIPSNPYNDIYMEHSEFLKTINTKEEVLIAIWCLNNLVPLRHPENNKKWITITYEELVINPEKTIKRVLNTWGIDYDLSLINFTKDSFSTKEDSPTNTVNRISSWQENLSDNQKERMGRVLEYFNVIEYNKEKPFPEKTFN